MMFDICDLLLELNHPTEALGFSSLRNPESNGDPKSYILSLDCFRHKNRNSPLCAAPRMVVTVVWQDPTTPTLIFWKYRNVLSWFQYDHTYAHSVSSREDVSRDRYSIRRIWGDRRRINFPGETWGVEVGRCCEGGLARFNCLDRSIIIDTFFFLSFVTILALFSGRSIRFEFPLNPVG